IHMNGGNLLYRYLLMNNQIVVPFVLFQTLTSPSFSFLSKNSSIAMFANFACAICVSFDNSRNFSIVSSSKVNVTAFFIILPPRLLNLNTIIHQIQYNARLLFKL